MANQIPRRLRFEILRRDKHTCRYCGAMAPDVVLTVDHVIPLALGGGDEPTNLVTACAACNGGKASIAPDSSTVADVEASALLWARALEKAADYRRMEREGLHLILDDFEDTWRGWGWDQEDGTRKSVILPCNWASSIERFLDLGLTPQDLRELIPTAMTKDGLPLDARFKYFCGCCWRSIGDLQETARQILEDEREWT